MEPQNQNGILLKKNPYKGEIFFYSTGVKQEAIRTSFKDELNDYFSSAHIALETDLTAAGRALYHHKSGITAILGTGANAGWYNGQNITHQPISLGFLLGDEGSGAYIGKRILKDYIENHMPEEIINTLKNHFQTDKENTIKTIYKNYTGATFGSIIPIIQDYFTSDYFNQLLLESFEAFFHHIVNRITYIEEKNIAFVGSIAYTFQKQLREIAQKHDFNITDIAKNTKEQLIHYHITRIG